MQAAESYQALVVYSVVQIALGFLDERVDLFQSFQIPYGRGEKETEYHVYIIGESLVALLLIANEVYHHIGFEIAQCHTHALAHDDTQGDGDIGRARPHLFHIRYTQDDENPPFVKFVACPLVGIADVRKEIVGNIESFLQILLVLLCGACNLYPAVGLPFRNGL